MSYVFAIRAFRKVVCRATYLRRNGERSSRPIIYAELSQRMGEKGVSETYFKIYYSYRGGARRAWRAIRKITGKRIERERRSATRNMRMRLPSFVRGRRVRHLFIRRAAN